MAHTNPDSSPLARETLVGGVISAAVRPAVVPASSQRSPVAGAWGDFPSSSGWRGPVGLAHERMDLVIAGFPWDIITTIQSARVSSTCWVYDGKWRVFKKWCAREVAFQSTVPSFQLHHLVCRFMRDLTPPWESIDGAEGAVASFF